MAMTDKTIIFVAHRLSISERTKLSFLTKVKSLRLVLIKN